MLIYNLVLLEVYTTVLQWNQQVMGPARFHRLLFDGNEENFEFWETKFLAYMNTLTPELKTTITKSAPAVATAADTALNGRAYSELIQFLDDKSLSLIIREAADDGRKALGILRKEYAGISKPKIVQLYIQLTTLEMGSDSVTEYIIRAEKIITSLKRAKELSSEALIIAMILKGLPDSFKAFSIYVNTRDEDLLLAEFKSSLRKFEESENLNSKVKGDNLMKFSANNYRNSSHNSRGC